MTNTIGKFVRGAPAFTEEKLTPMLASHVKDGGLERKVVKTMNKDHKNVEESLKGWADVINLHRKSMMEAEKELAKTCKDTSTNVRTASNHLGEALTRMEKVCNFDKLERYVGLLERASTAIDSLAVLEKAGKLDKIFSALK
jgi:hypothetical protein